MNNMPKKEQPQKQLHSPLEIAGTWAFVIGFTIAVILGIFNKTSANSKVLLWFLLILGLIIAFLNITAHEIIPFLIVGIALMLTGTITEHIPINWLKNSISNIVVFVLPGVIVSAIKSVLAIASTK